ncbi:MAG: hypothetical protein H8D23_21630 [Candidatus Brocadiales bacterium]|nr:hypothetical protein [Candidatus Brocadiales bacterium]
MGAYYQGTIATKESEGEFTRYSTWDVKCGAKLMEHSYVFNGYVNAVLNKCPINEDFNLVWLCDYHEEKGFDWDCVSGSKDFENNNDQGFNTNYFINKSKGIYIDMVEVVARYWNKGVKDYMIHPIPLLCNSDNEAMGGGDYREFDSRRGKWKDDIFIITWDAEKVKDLKNVTKDCLFFEKH